MFKISHHRLLLDKQELVFGLNNFGFSFHRNHNIRDPRKHVEATLLSGPPARIAYTAPPELLTEPL
jgi:hypothetical protein